MTIKLTLDKRYAGKKPGDTIEVQTDAEKKALEAIGLVKAPAKAEKASKSD